MLQDKIRVGFIGAGQNSRKLHIPKLLALPGVELREIANRTLASAEKISSEFNIHKARASWQEIIASADIDAIVIGTWPYLHCESTCAALEAGKHVLCEARMAMNLSEAEQMQKASKAHPNLVSQLVPAPFTLHSDKTIREYIDQDRLGDLLYFHVDYQSNTVSSCSTPLHWRRNKKYSGENTMVLGIIYESICRWIPPAKMVNATGKIFNNNALDPETGELVPVEIPDYLSIQMEMKNGIRGSMLLSEAGLHSPCPSIKLFGTGGTLKIDLAPDGEIWYGAKSSDFMQEVKIRPRDKGYWRVEEEFINAIRGKENVQLTTFDAGVDYMSFTQAVMDSYRENGRTKFL